MTFPYHTEINSKLSNLTSVLVDIEDRLKSTLSCYCESHDYLFSIRIKDAKSISEKIETGRFRSWEEINDLVACSIIVTESKSVKNTLKYLKSTFEEVTTINKHSSYKRPNEFRFDASRFYGRIRAGKGIEEDSDIRSIIFEVQVPTLLDYTWQKLTRKISYKNEISDWRLDRISAHFRSNIEQMEVIASNPRQFRSLMTESTWPEIKSKEKICLYFNGKIESGAITKLIEPQSWSRFSDSFYSLSLSFYDDHTPSKKISYRIGKSIQIIEDWMTKNEFASSLSLIGNCLGILIDHYNKMPNSGIYKAYISPTMSTLFPKSDPRKSDFKL